MTLSYGMTIHKSQGQTFDFVGLLVDHNVFTHGQIYVGLSRVRKFSNLKIQIKKIGQKMFAIQKDNKIYIKNIVYR